MQAEVEYACGPSGNIDEVERLIERRGARALATWRFGWLSSSGCTALIYAVWNSDDPRITQALIDAGVDVNAKGDCGQTALHRATSAEVAAVLIANGASLSIRDDAGCTPLHEACYWRRWDIARLMLREPECLLPSVLLATDDMGNTPLDAFHFATCLSDTETPLLLSLLDPATRGAEVWCRRRTATLVGLAAGDAVKAAAVRAGKDWQL